MIRVVLAVSGLVVLIMIFVSINRVASTPGYGGQPVLVGQANPQPDNPVQPAAPAIRQDPAPVPTQSEQISGQTSASPGPSGSRTTGGGAGAPSAIHLNTQTTGVGTRKTLAWDVPLGHTLIVWGVRVGDREYAALTFPSGNQTVEILDGAGYYVHDQYAAQEFCRTVEDARYYGGLLVDVQAPAGARC